MLYYGGASLGTATPRGAALASLARALVTAGYVQYGTGGRLGVTPTASGAEWLAAYGDAVKAAQAGYVRAAELILYAVTKTSLQRAHEAVEAAIAAGEPERLALHLVEVSRKPLDPLTLTDRQVDVLRQFAGLRPEIASIITNGATRKSLRTRGLLEAAGHGMERITDAGREALKAFAPATVKTQREVEERHAEFMADSLPAPASGPRFPKGTPEYAAYERELQAELAKFAAGEEPYPYRPEELGRDGGRAAREMGIERPRKRRN
jgi:hypothetical protein